MVAVAQSPVFSACIVGRLREARYSSSLDRDSIRYIKKRIE